jgi:DNA-binding response OmpR family regulator
MRALIVETKLFVAEAPQAEIRHEAIAADIALDGAAALDRLAANDYDVIVLDRDIPWTHGDQADRQGRRLRARYGRLTIVSCRCAVARRGVAP